MNIQENAMDAKGIVWQPKWLQGRCPFCFKKIGIIQKVKREVSGKYKCRNCNKIIDERFIVR